MYSSTHFALLAVAGCLLAASPAIAGAQVSAPAAPAGASILNGRVVDANGQPVAHAQVVLLPEGAAPRPLPLSSGGRFATEFLPPGRYVLRATAFGFAPAAPISITLPLATGAAELVVRLTAREAALAAVNVVGQKRRTSTVNKAPVPLEDLPISVQIVGTEIIRQQQAIDLRDIVRNVSGVTPTGTYNGGYVFFNSRGFGMNNWSNFRRNGMMVWNMGHHFADNIEQVELLKGPASIQYGDVAPGGIMNFVTKQPVAQAQRTLEMKVGQYGLARPTVDVNQPLNASGTLLSRLNATYERSGSFRDEVQHQAVMLAPTLSWRPSSRLTWTVEGTYKYDDRVGDPGLISPDGTFAGLAQVPMSRFLGEPDARYRFRDVGLYSTLSYALQPAWKLQQVTYWSDTERAPNNIYLEGTSADATGNVDRSQYSFNQWFRGGGASLDLIGETVKAGVRHRVVIGADGMKNLSRFTNGIDAMLDRPISISSPQYGQATLGVAPRDWNDAGFQYTRYGVYAQDQMSVLDDRLQLLLGARFNATSTGNEYIVKSAQPADFRRIVDRVWSPRVGIVGKPAPGLSLYGSYAQSYEMNGTDWIDPSIVIAPTSARQLEVGAKASLLRDRLGVTLSAFEIEKDDIYGWIDATSRPTIPIVAWDSAGAWATYQGGTHRSRGLELDVNGRLANALTVSASASLIDAQVVRDNAFPAGNTLEGTAREIGNLWLNYVVPSGGALRALAGLEVGGGLFHRGRFYQTTANEEAARVDAFTSMDVAVGYRFDKVQARLNVSNIGNARGYLSSFGVYEPLWVRRAVLSLSTSF